MAAALLLSLGPGGGGLEPGEAPDFAVTDRLGRTFSLSDRAGTVTVLHVTQLENPLCIECEQYMVQQILALQELEQAGEASVEIVTLNVRANPYSEDGWSIAERWYGANITWYWVEEFEPYEAAGKYIRYWEVAGGFANPTVILIGPDRSVIGLYNVYCIGKGPLDGVQTAEALAASVAAILDGSWESNLEGSRSSEGLTLGGFFLLGVATSFSPCSIALLMVIISYVATIRDKGNPGESAPKGLLEGVQIGLYFTLGMALVFLTIGLLIAYLGGFIRVSDSVQLVIGAVLVVLGVNAVKPWREILRGVRRAPGARESCRSVLVPGIREVGNTLLSALAKRSSSGASLLLGVLFSLGWAPCALSLVFPVILLMLAQEVSLLLGGTMMFFFGVGHGLVIVPFCAATGDLRARLGNRYIAAGKWIQIAFGLTIVAIGIVYGLRFFGFRLW